MFAAAASAFVLPLADAIGWGLTMTIAAIISVNLYHIILPVLTLGTIVAGDSDSPSEHPVWSHLERKRK